MGHRGVNRTTACVIAMLCVVAVFAPPRRYEIDGLSMAPRLLPGDVVESGWFPLLDRLRKPRRYERWILTTPDGAPAIKRVAGLPGETISIRDGDLAIGGRTVLTPPRILAEQASAVPEAGIVSDGDDGPDGRWQRTVAPSDVLDDASFATEERRLLLPVRDVGLAAVIRLCESPSKDEAVHARIRVGDAVLPWRIKAGGRYAVVAGRLDGHVVGAAWPISDVAGRLADAGHALPPQAPAAWDVALPWPDALASDDESGPTALALGIAVNGIPMGRTDADAVIERVVVWRDILYRPAADGAMEWLLGSDAFFVFGDFPAGSRDSRHWGPLGRGAFRHCAHTPE